MTQGQAVLIEQALKTLECTQAQLAKSLEVSPTQITKWKNGEHMSGAMETRLRGLAKIGKLDPKVVRSAGSVANAKKWEELIRRLASDANDDSDSGIQCEPLRGAGEGDSYYLDMISCEVVAALDGMGVTLPRDFPPELDVRNIEDSHDADEAMLANPYGDLINRILVAYANVYGFYEVFFLDLAIGDNDASHPEGIAENIEPGLVGLAATKIEEHGYTPDPAIAPKFKEYCARTEREYGPWLDAWKRQIIDARVTMRAELRDLVDCSDVELAMQAEAEILGPRNRAHPDIYMNELLEGVREIRQGLRELLPAIRAIAGPTAVPAPADDETPCE